MKTLTVLLLFVSSFAFAQVELTYGPYATLAAAKAAIPQAVRYSGLTVHITGMGNYYWLAGNLTDSGLIIKESTSPTLTNPIIGAATGTSLFVTGSLGYATGAGGTVTQTTNRTTGVTISKICGTITTMTTSLAALAAATFTVTNTLVGVNDVIVLSVKGGATNVKTFVKVTTVAAGSFNITVHNVDASTAEVGAIVINFVVIKSVTN